jgi:hypothetical protein
MHSEFVLCPILLYRTSFSEHSLAVLDPHPRHFGIRFSKFEGRVVLRTVRFWTQGLQDRSTTLFLLPVRMHNFSDSLFL